MRCVDNDLLSEHTDGDDTIDWGSLGVPYNEKWWRGRMNTEMS